MVETGFHAVQYRKNIDESNLMGIKNVLFHSKAEKRFKI